MPESFQEGSRNFMLKNKYKRKENLPPRHSKIAVFVFPKLEVAYQTATENTLGLNVTFQSMHIFA